MTGDGKWLTLFVAGDAPRSRRARANLAAALEEAGGDIDAVREVDLLTEPQRALDSGIFATPALMIDAGAEERSIMYGDLSETAKLESFLAGIFAAAA